MSFIERFNELKKYNLRLLQDEAAGRKPEDFRSGKRAAGGKATAPAVGDGDAESEQEQEQDEAEPIASHAPGTGEAGQRETEEDEEEGPSARVE